MQFFFFDNLAAIASLRDPAVKSPISVPTQVAGLKQSDFT